MSKFQVSIVTAVYNVESFLREAINSVIQQDIGFENIQLILVNDGSTDKSGAVCDEYAAKYPNNIIVIHKENGGVSSARNEGLKYAEGRYINFLDGDDKLAPNTVSEVCKFFEECKDMTDVVTIPIYFFDAQNGEHPLNSKFSKETRVIDLKDEWNIVQLSIASCFVKRDCFDDVRFDVNLAYAEDAQILLKILLNKQTIGVVKGPKYLYRQRRSGAASAIQSSGNTYAWYFPYLENFSEYIIRYCKELLGEVPRFVQSTIMYDLQWRFKRAHVPNDLLTSVQAEEYRKRLFSLLVEIDDDIILAQKRLVIEQGTVLVFRKQHASRY